MSTVSIFPAFSTVKSLYRLDRSSWGLLLGPLWSHHFSLHGPNSSPSAAPHRASALALGGWGFWSSFKPIPVCQTFLYWVGQNWSWCSRHGLISTEWRAIIPPLHLLPLLLIETRILLASFAVRTFWLAHGVAACPQILFGRAAPQPVSLLAAFTMHQDKLHCFTSHLMLLLIYVPLVSSSSQHKHSRWGRVQWSVTKTFILLFPSSRHSIFLANLRISWKEMRNFIPERSPSVKRDTKMPRLAIRGRQKGFCGFLVMLWVLFFLFSFSSIHLMYSDYFTPRST